jgi:RNA polymerase sigma-70 factor (ECF subfamily)
LAQQKSDAIVAELARSTTTMPGDPDFEEQLRDDELRMIFMCCHPEIPRDSAVALSLKTIGGFSVREIARAFLEDEPTIAQRLVRAKRRIRSSNLTLEMPHGEALRERLDSVLEVIYFVFNEGYSAHEGEQLIRRDLCLEALRLARLIASSTMSAPRAHALVAFLALQSARIPARTDEVGDLILLEDQDRSRWDQQLIALGFHHFDLAMSGDEVSEYHAQAAIAATHTRASSEESIQWETILHLYDQLFALNASPIVALNRAVVISKVRGPAEALAAIKPFEKDSRLRHYHPYFALLGRLYLDLGRRDEAASSFREALECRCSEPERRFLRRMLAECG